MISVIIPVYNGEKYIDRVYDSFVKQTYTDFELIFVNDGSTDESIKKIETLSAENIVPITYMTQTRGGVSAARNTGLALAKGDYICFCDVDDTVMSTYLEDMHTLLVNEDIDLVIGRDQFNKDGDNQLDKYTGNGYIMPAQMALEKYLYGNINTNCCVTMVKSKFLRRHDLTFANDYKYGEDLHMLWRMIAYSTNVAYLDKPLYIYHLQPNTAMSTFNSDRFHAYYLIQKLEKLIQKKHQIFYNKFKKHAANKVLWSIAWQWSTKVTNQEFRQFIEENQVKRSMYDLLTFKDKKVALSALLCIISPSVFRKIAMVLGKRYIA